MMKATLLFASLLFLLTSFAAEPAATAYLKIPNLDLRRARCHVTDAVRTYTEVPLVRAADGSYIVRMQPNSFALVEW